MYDKTTAPSDAYDFLVGAAVLATSFFAGAVLNSLFSTPSEKNAREEKHKMQIQQLTVSPPSLLKP